MTKIAVLIDAADERAQNLWSWGMEAERIALEQHDDHTLVAVEGGVNLLAWTGCAGACSAG